MSILIALCIILCLPELLGLLISILVLALAVVVILLTIPIILVACIGIPLGFTEFKYNKEKKNWNLTIRDKKPSIKYKREGEP